MFNLTTKILTTKDNPVEGSIYYDIPNNKLYTYINYNWEEIMYGISNGINDINIKRKDKIISMKNRV
jgi:hypothetical protein